MYNNKTNKPYSDQKNWSNTYLTDPKIISITGPYDLDPACPETMPWNTATTHYSEGALERDWFGRVWLNPPYRGVLKWIEKFVSNGSGICLLNGRSTETRATQLAIRNASAVFFPFGRLTFFKETGEPYEQKWFSSVLVGLTNQDKESLQKLNKEYNGVLLLNRIDGNV